MNQVDRIFGTDLNEGITIDVDCLYLMSQDFVDDGLVDLPMIIGVFVVDFFELFLPDSHDCAEGLSEGGHLSGFFIKGSLKLHDLIKLIIFESLGAVVGLLEIIDFVE